MEDGRFGEEGGPIDEMEGRQKAARRTGCPYIRTKRPILHGRLAVQDTAKPEKHLKTVGTKVPASLLMTPQQGTAGAQGVH